MSLFYFLKTLLEKQLLFILTFFEPFTKWKMKRSESKFCKLSDCLDFFLLQKSKKKLYDTKNSYFSVRLNHCCVYVFTLKFKSVILLQFCF
jgi:hypothetical protein